MDLLIFDLDGTLIDSQLDLVHSVNAMRRHMGLALLSQETIASYVGNGAPVLVRRARRSCNARATLAATAAPEHIGTVGAAFRRRARP